MIPGVAGVLFFITAATVTIVLIVKRSGKDDSATTRQQTKELKEDPCVTLLAEYVKAGESGMAGEQLKAVYAKGFAQCPAVFPPLQQQNELPKLEEVQARLVKKQEEQKREGGVNTVNTSNSAAEKDEESKVLGTKGSKAVNALKPATVPQAKDEVKEIKNNVKVTNTHGSKSSEEADPAKRLLVSQPTNNTSEDKSPTKVEIIEQQPNLQPPHPSGPNVSKPALKGNNTKKEDENSEMISLIDAVYKLPNPDDQVKLLAEVKGSKASNSADARLIDLLISSVRNEKVNDGIVSYMTNADYKNSQHLAAIMEALERMSKCDGKGPLYLAFLDLWKVFVSLIQNVRDRLDESNAQGKTIESCLQLAPYFVSPFKIAELGNYLSSSKLGAEGLELVEQCARCIKLNADSDSSELHKEDVAFSEAYLEVYNSLHGRRCTSYSKNFAGVPENVVNIIHNHKKLYSQHNKTYKGDLIRLVSSDYINALKSQLDTLGLDSKQKEFDNLQKILEVSAYDKAVVLVLLKVHPINTLREFLRRNFVFDWEPTKVDTPVSLADVTNLFDQCNKQRADKTAEKKFLEAAEKYSLMRQHEIMSEIKSKAH